MQTFAVETWSPRDKVSGLVTRFELVKINAIEWNGSDGDVGANFVEAVKGDASGARRFPVRCSRPQLQTRNRSLPPYVNRDIVIEVRPFPNKDEFFLARVTSRLDCIVNACYPNAVFGPSKQVIGFRSQGSLHVVYLCDEEDEVIKKERALFRDKSHSAFMNAGHAIQVMSELKKILLAPKKEDAKAPLEEGKKAEDDNNNNTQIVKSDEPEDVPEPMAVKATMEELLVEELTDEFKGLVRGFLYNMDSLRTQAEHCEALKIEKLTKKLELEAALSLVNEEYNELFLHETQVTDMAMQLEKSHEDALQSLRARVASLGAKAAKGDVFPAELGGFLSEVCAGCDAPPAKNLTYQCVRGHLICANCYGQTGICPLCRYALGPRPFRALGKHFPRPLIAHRILSAGNPAKPITTFPFNAGNNHAVIRNTAGDQPVGECANQVGNRQVQANGH